MKENLVDYTQINSPTSPISLWTEVQGHNMKPGILEVYVYWRRKGELGKVVTPKGICYI
jgi:hypothetical protein